MRASPSFDESVNEGIRKDWENSKTSQSDGNKERDKLRLALWQAAIGYKLSPCDNDHEEEPGRGADRLH